MSSPWRVDALGLGPTRSFTVVAPIHMAMACSSTSAIKHGQVTCETSSRSVAGSITATHSYEVTNFSQFDIMDIGECVSSSNFSVGGSDWNINVYPNGEITEDDGAVSVFLNLLRGTSGMTSRSILSLLDKDDQVLKQQKARWTFPSVGRGFGWPKFIEKSRLQTLLRLHGDRFKIRCVLAVKVPNTEEGSAIVVPEPNMHQDLTVMLKNRKGADVTFSVGDQSFPAHKCILAARSKVFDAELFGTMKEKDAHCIKIDDMEPTIFEALLHFIYTDSLPDEFNNGDKNVAMQHLVVAADRYDLDRLRLMCEAKLYQDINVQTVATTLVLAEQHHFTQLKDACIGFIASNDTLSAILETDGFKHLVASYPSIMKEILDKIGESRRVRRKLN